MAMDEMTKIAVDAMGGDNAPLEIVKGVVEAVNENSKIKVYLTGLVYLYTYGGLWQWMK